MKRERSHSHDSASSSLSSKASGESPLGTLHTGLPPSSETGKNIQGRADPGLLVRTQGHAVPDFRSGCGEQTHKNRLELKLTSETLKPG